MKLVQYIKVKTGEYQKDGQTKGKYETVGRVLQDDSGKKMYLLNKWFNPAGLPDKDNRDSIILNIWDATEKDASPPNAHEAAKPNGYQPQPIDDEIPF